MTSESIDLATGQPGDFALGLPIFAKHASDITCVDLQYENDLRGGEMERFALARFMLNSRGGNACDGKSEELGNRLCFSYGSSGALSQILNAFVPRTGEKTTVIVENPTYHLALNNITRHLGDNGEILTVGDGAQDNNNIENENNRNSCGNHPMSATALKEAIAKAKYRVSLVFMISRFHNPTGESVFSEEMMRIASVCENNGVACIASDDVYEFLPHIVTTNDGDIDNRYEQKGKGKWIPITEAARYVCKDFESCSFLSIGSASKLLSPAMRFGWIESAARNSKWVESFENDPEPRSGGSRAALSSKIFARAISCENPKYALGDHLVAIRKKHGTAAVAMIDALNDTISTMFDEKVRASGTIRVHGADAESLGGYFVWLSFFPPSRSKLTLQSDDTIDNVNDESIRIEWETRLAERLQGRVRFVPGSRFRIKGAAGPPAVRLCFVRNDPDRIKKAVGDIVGEIKKMFDEI